MRKLLIAILVLIAVGVTVWFMAVPGNKPTPAPLRTVVVNQAFEHLLYIGLYVAKDSGLFEREGLDVKIETGGGDAQAFSALTSGKAQFAQGDPAFVAIAAEKGWQGRVIAMAVDRVAIWGVTLDHSLMPFSDPKGFKGLKVATYPEPNTSYVVQKELALRAGLQVGRDVTIVQVPFGTELATLRNRQVDIAQTIEPNVAQVEKEGGKVIFSYPDAWGPLAFTGVMTSKSLIDEKPEIVGSFVRAYEAALQLIQSDRVKALMIARKRLPTLDPALIEVALNRLVESHCIPAHARVDPESWRKLLDIRLKVGDIKAIPPLEQIVDNRFAENAAQAKKP